MQLLNCGAILRGMMVGLDEMATSYISLN